MGVRVRQLARMPLLLLLWIAHTHGHLAYLRDGRLVSREERQQRVAEVNPGVFVNIQQVNVQQPREVNFGVGEQRFKNEENEENPKNGIGGLNGSRPNDKFLESFYNRSVLLPSVLQKIFSLRSIIRKRERNTNDEKSGNYRDVVDSATAVACGVSRPCLTHKNQTGDGSKQLDIEIPTENDINISSDRNEDIETLSDSNHDII